MQHQPGPHDRIAPGAFGGGTIGAMASEPPRPDRRRRGLPASAGSVGLVALAVVVTLFAVLNLGSVEVNWIVGSSHAPLIIVIAVSILLGVAGGALAQRQASRRRKRG